MELLLLQLKIPRASCLYGLDRPGYQNFDKIKSNINSNLLNIEILKNERDTMTQRLLDFELNIIEKLGISIKNAINRKEILCNPIKIIYLWGNQKRLI